MLPPSAGPFAIASGRVGAALVAVATFDGRSEQTATLLDVMKALELSRLGRLRELAHVPAPEPLPDLAAGEVAAWCEATLGSGDRAAGLGRVIGLVGETYRHRGWTVLAAGIGTGDRVTDLPPFDELVAAVSAHFDARAADDAVAALDGAPDLDALAAVDAAPPGHALVTALTTLADAIAADPAALSVAAALGDQIAAPWSWERVAAWSGEDPTAWAKACARAHGRGRWVAALEDVRVSIATELDAVVATCWTTTLGEARAELPPITTDPVVAAIANLGDIALGEAVRRIARAARDDLASAGALCAQLVGDPRRIDTWHSAIPALLAALPVNPPT